MQVFLSHSAQDRKFADALRRQLLHLGVDVWNPDRELLPGSNWLLESGRALERADGIVFLFSKEAARSQWSPMEVQYAISQPKYEGRVVTVLRAPRIEIPWILHNLPVVDAAKHTPAQVAREIYRQLRADQVPAKTKVRRQTSAKRSRKRQVTHS
jgi:hypothetical protein